MDAEQLRKFKHELRTPVNHILGYSELLLETASDAADQGAADMARSIQSCGQTLARLVENNLLSLTSGAGQPQIAALREAVVPLVEQILRASTAQPAFSQAPAYSDDLARIRQAAKALLEML